MYNVPNLGFVWQNFDAIVAGIVRSIERAHSAVTDGRILVNSGQLLDTNINRSPTAYENNPRAERDRYGANTDTTMTLLKLVTTSGQPLGAVAWFPVHCTSMNNTNHLISGDNKGYASMRFEQDINGGTLVGKGPFVALFPNSNEGDVSPNTKGPRCVDTGLPCDAVTSTCNGNVEKCIAFGPGSDMFESTRIIGDRQYRFAKDLYDKASQEVSGPIEYVHQTINMENVTITLPDNTTGKTCKAAMGVSFAAGTTDGPGYFPFKQGDTTNRLWRKYKSRVKNATRELLSCQHPKPVLLPTGDLKWPYPWQPSILPTQILRIGHVLVASVPAELTTMSGRRLRDAVKSAYEMNSQQNISVVPIISGLSNTYSSYVTTFEEYQIQRYEGASTVYGPYTLDAYLQQYRLLASRLAAGTHNQLPSGPSEPNYLNKQISLVPGVLFDCSPGGKKFGDCITEPNGEYTIGSRVKVSFISGNPRNSVRDESTFLAVERFDSNTNKWTLVATDANWETRFLWQKVGFPLFSCHSIATIIWDIPDDTTPGVYRIRHFGDYKDWTMTVYTYYGSTKQFRVSAYHH
ncbi:unnamed protein product [Medioppia subpectinata]|uniref:Neutral ceramidase n=1 Tax=Medioppia subpectinata TaxID=1979941 RepID=A0A7R9Q0R6_9ACAR|nr:unnamed protein product [Medioppia subpectinata]CAG2107816.1 unnamed protein product [Medioppia subpectinata]